MKIGHFNTDLAARGGIETYIRRLGAAQEKHGGHSITYFTRGSLESTPPGTLAVRDDQDLYAQAQQLALDVLHLHRPVGEPPPPGLKVVRTVHDNAPACPSGSRYLARREQPCERVYSLAGCLAGVYLDHCGTQRPGKTLRMFRKHQRQHRILPQMLSIAVSQYVKDEMVRGGYPADRIRVIHSPGPDSDLAPSPVPDSFPPRLLVVGRLVPQKGVAWLLRAAARVALPFELDVAGEGRALADLKKLAHGLGVADRVHFHGWVEGERVTALLDASRALIVPSVWQEPAGLVTLEAASRGRAVIASLVGGIPEYALREYAMLVKPHDVDGLASAMTTLLKDRQLAVEMGARGRQAVEAQFSMPQFLAAHEEAYVSQTFLP